MHRRHFLRDTTLLAGGLATGLTLKLSGCRDGGKDSGARRDAGGDGTDGYEPLRSGEILLGLYPSTTYETAEDAVRASLARLPFDWLGEGDVVFVKLSCNSGRVHPAVTSPAAVVALCEVLFERGAGRVLVGDQAGVESVRLAADERRFSSTRALMEANGLYAAILAAGAEPHFFDDHGYEAGYFAATPPAGHHWGHPLMLPNVVRDVDHIVTLPRLSSHTLAGYTHGLKCAVGWMRDDSRHHMHNDAATLHEKYAEISYTEELAARTRLVLTFAEQLMLHQGPDTGTVADVDPRIVIASDDLAHHDAFSAALLRYFDVGTPVADGVSPYGDGSTANTLNQVFTRSYVESATGIPWASDGGDYTALRANPYWDGVNADLALARAFALQGGVPEQVTVRKDGAALAGELGEALSAAYGGLFGLQG
jgi:uncharacterized protein (DUF362 family)